MVALAAQLRQSALRTHLGVGRDEDLELGVGEDSRTDVAAIHDDALMPSHLLLLRGQEAAHEAEGCHGAYLRGDLHRADGLLDTLAIEIELGAGTLLR